MPWRRLFAICGAFPVAAAVWLAGGGADDSPSGSTEGSLRDVVRGEIERLGAAERSERLAAEQVLLNRGPAILPLLPADAEIEDPAARAGLERIRVRLLEAQAAEAVGPTCVTVIASGPIGTVLGRQDSPTPPRRLPAGIEVAFTSDQASRNVSLDLVNRYAWSAIDEAARQANLWPAEFDDSGALSFRNRTPGDDAKRTAYPQSFRVAAGPLSLRPVAGAENRRLVRVPVEFRAEPKLRPLFLTFSAADFTLGAGDAKLAPFTPEAKHEIPFGERGREVGFRLDFVASADVPPGLFHLTGKAKLTVAVETASFIGFFEEIETAGGTVLPVKHREANGGVEVRFREMVLNTDGTAEAEISVVYERGGPAFESYRGWVFHNEAELLFEAKQDAEPTQFRLDHEPEFSTVAQSNGGVVLRYRFSGIPRDAGSVRFRYVAPTRILDVPFDFTVEELAASE